MKNEWEVIGDGVILIWLQRPKRFDGRYHLYGLISEESFDRANSISGTWYGHYNPHIRLWYVYDTQHKNTMQKFLLDTSRVTKTHADHICIPDTLNNTLINLRILNPTESQRHRRKRQDTASKYRNVYWHHHAQKWGVRYKKDGRWSTVGYYDSEDEAGRVSNEIHAKHALFDIPTPSNAIYIPGSRSIFPIVPDYIFEKAGVLHLREEQQNRLNETPL